MISTMALLLSQTIDSFGSRKPSRDLRKGCGKAKRKERKAERQNKKKGRR